jgi:hypothetical protein
MPLARAWKACSKQIFHFTKAEAGDPLCIEDPTSKTTDTESNLKSSWDKDNKDEDTEFDLNVDKENIEIV